MDVEQIYQATCSKFYSNWSTFANTRAKGSEAYLNKLLEQITNCTYLKLCSHFLPSLIIFLRSSSTFILM